MISISGVLLEKVKNLVSHNEVDDRLPTVLCPACKTVIYQGKKTRKSQKSEYDLQESINNFLLIRINMRSKNNSDTCEYCLCKLVSVNSRNKKKVSRTNTEKVMNILKDTVNKRETGLSPLIEDQKIVLSQKRGRPVEVVLKARKKQKPSVISSDTLEKMKSNLNLSDRKLYGLAAAINSESNGSVRFEKHFKQRMKNDTHKFDEFFEVCDFSFVKEKQNVKSDAAGKAVICKNLQGFIDCVTKKRSAGEVHIKFGIYGGGGYLKFCMSLLLTNVSTILDAQEFKKKKNCNKKFSEGGVKKLFIICIAPDVQENYTNISLIWKKLNMDVHLENGGTIAADLKIVNMICGLMSSASTYPCPYCDTCTNNLFCSGDSRTVIQCDNNYKEWSSSKKCSRKNAKNFKNCVNSPLLPHVNKKILNYIPPPELHLLLGAVNTIFDKMSAEFEGVSLMWAKQCNVSKACAYGNYAFVGNDCNKLLNSLDILDSMKILGVCKYVELLRNLKKVVDGCFSVRLDPEFKDYLKSFKLSYLALEISVTPKIHIIFEHIEEFCEFSQQGLGYYSEQAMEAVHCDFKTTWNNIIKYLKIMLYTLINF